MTLPSSTVKPHGNHCCGPTLPTSPSFRTSQHGTGWSRGGSSGEVTHQPSENFGASNARLGLLFPTHPMQSYGYMTCIYDIIWPYKWRRSPTWISSLLSSQKEDPKTRSIHTRVRCVHSRPLGPSCSCHKRGPTQRKNICMVFRFFQHRHMAMGQY